MPPLPVFGGSRQSTSSVPYKFEAQGFRPPRSRATAERALAGLRASVPSFEEEYDPSFGLAQEARNQSRSALRAGDLADAAHFAQSAQDYGTVPGDVEAEQDYASERAGRRQELPFARRAADEGLRRAVEAFNARYLDPARIRAGATTGAADIRTNDPETEEALRALAEMRRAQAEVARQKAKPGGWSRILSWLNPFDEDESGASTGLPPGVTVREIP